MTRSRFGLGLAAACLLPAALHAQSPDWSKLALPRTHAPQPTTAAITPADLMTRLYLFADDSMGGRLLGSAGNAKGVEYIASELRRFGLEPMGDNGSYFQTVPVFTREVDSTATISARAAPPCSPGWTSFPETRAPVLAAPTAFPSSTAAPGAIPPRSSRPTR